MCVTFCHQIFVNSKNDWFFFLIYLFIFLIMLQFDWLLTFWNRWLNVYIFVNKNNKKGRIRFFANRDFYRCYCVTWQHFLLFFKEIDGFLKGNSPSSVITEQNISVAFDLYRGEIPELWRKSSGPCAPPRDWNWSSWINDFQNRCTHIEKILVLVSLLRS